jgi:enoyl-CoA hydratase/carnithine racemase
LLPRLCGYGHASLLLLTGEPVDAAQAQAMGIVQKICDDEEVVGAARAVAEIIAANAPIATQSAKAAVRAALGTSLSDGMNYEEELVAVCMGSRDRHEGIEAFFAKRPPEFDGR